MEDTVPVSAFEALRTRAIGLQKQVAELETALRISNMVGVKRSESLERRAEGKEGRIESVLLDLGVDVVSILRITLLGRMLKAHLSFIEQQDRETPILFSPSFLDLLECPHCHRAVPRRARDGDRQKRKNSNEAGEDQEWEHIDAWRTEHWACLPFITNISPWAQMVRPPFLLWGSESVIQRAVTDAYSVK